MVNIMTKVSTTASYRIPGIYEPIEYIVETHTICDECGSANISYKGSAHLPAIVNEWFSLVILLCFYGGVFLTFIESLFGLLKYNWIIWGLWIISIVALIVFFCLTTYVERNNNKNPKCNVCGNEHIT
jgi:hypothetical protein